MNLSFIKVDINILDDTKIKLIRTYPDGEKLIVLWLGLLCLGMKSDTPGYIYITNDIPYTVSDLSKVLDIEEKTIQMGLELFKQYKMIDIINGGVIEIINFNRHQKLDKIEQAREASRITSKRYREKQKQLLSDMSLTKSDKTDKEQDKNKIKKKKYREYVFLNKNEYKKLIDDYGKIQVDIMLDKLDNYKGAKGKKYKSDYRAILSWVIESVKAEPIKKEYIICPACGSKVIGTISYCGKCGLEKQDFKNSDKVREAKQYIGG